MPVNIEGLFNPQNELRTTHCSICGAQEVREVATMRGLETVVKCLDCEYEYFTRGDRNP